MGKRVADMTPEERERKKARNAAWRLAHSEELRACRLAHSEELKAKSAAYYAANPEKIKAKRKAWREANPGKSTKRSKAWRAANPERAKEKGAAYKAAHPEADVVSALKRHSNITDPPPELVAAIVSLRKLKRAIKERC